MSDLVTIDAKSDQAVESSDALFWEEWLGDDVDTPTLIEEAAQTATLKHLPGQHDQGKHAPKKYGAGNISKLSADELRGQGYIAVYRGTGPKGTQEVRPSEEGVLGPGVYFYDSPIQARSYAERDGGIVTGFVHPDDVLIEDVPSGMFVLPHKVVVLQDPSKFVRRGDIPTEETRTDFDYGPLLERAEQALDEVRLKQLSTQYFVMDMAQWLRLKHLAHRRMSQLLHRPDDYVLKHLSGQHDQKAHTPKAYRGGVDVSPLDYTDKSEYSRAKLGVSWSEKLVDGEWVKREGLASDEELSVIIGAEREWENELLKAIGRGDIEAKRDRHNDVYLTGHAFDNTRIYLPEIKQAEEFGPLPTELYHVTTAKTAIVEDNDGLLKSRYDLSQGRAKGLGGGSDNTISFTTDKAIADNIKERMLEARKVAKGDTTFDDLTEQAVKGEGAQEPWLRDWIKMEYGLTDVRSVDDIPEDIKLQGQGYEVHRSSLGMTPSSVKKFSKDTSVPIGRELAPKEGHGEWFPVGEGREAGGGERAHYSYARARPQVDTNDWTFNMYKSWLGFRQHAGGPENPLFWGTDAEYLASIDPSEVATLKYKPKPGAVGVKKSALGEWRTWDGDAVELESVE